MTRTTTLPTRRRLLRTGGDLPPLTTQARNATQALLRAAGAVVRGERLTVPDEEQARRLAICQAPCAKWTGTRCRACGCFARWKASLITETCPLGRW